MTRSEWLDKAAQEVISGYSEENGVTITWQTNAVGGRAYYGYSCGVPLQIFDTSLCNLDELLAVLSKEMELQKKERILKENEM